MTELSFYFHLQLVEIKLGEIVTINVTKSISTFKYFPLSTFVSPIYFFFLARNIIVYMSKQGKK